MTAPGLITRIAVSRLIIPTLLLVAPGCSMGFNNPTENRLKHLIAVAVQGGQVSPANSTLTVSSSTVPVGGTLTLTLTLFDSVGNPNPSGVTSESFTVTSSPGTGTLGSVTDLGGGAFQSVFTGTGIGTVTFGALVNGTVLTITVGTTVTIAPPAFTYTVPTPIYTRGVPISPTDAPVNTGGTVATYSISPALPAGITLNTSTGIIGGTSSVISPLATYTVTGTNAGGSSSASVHLTVNDVAPAFSYATNPASYTKGSAITANTVTSTGGPITSFSVSPALPAGLTLNTVTGAIDGTPTAPSANATYTVTATNSGGSATVGVQITILDIAPAFSYAVNPAGYIRTNAITPNTVVSTGGTIASFSVAPPLPAGLSLDPTTGTVSGTPTAIVANSTYTVTATNSIGSATVGLQIAVTDAPPAFSYAVNPATYSVGTGISSNTVTSTGGAIVSFSISPALPTGLAMFSTSGNIHGTPTVVTPTATYTVTATNSIGSTNVGLQITVNDIAPAFTYTANPVSYPMGSAITPNSPLNTGGSVVSYSVSPALPAGLSLNPSTGVITGTPTALTSQTTYTITGTNSGGSASAAIAITTGASLPALTAPPLSANGDIFDSILSSTRLYIGGYFTRAGYSTGSGAALDLTTGEHLSTLTDFPVIAGGSVAAAASDGSGGWYVGGTFTTVSNRNRSHLAHLLANGSLDESFPDFQITGGSISDLLISGSTLYMAGTFTSIAGVPRSYLASLDLTTKTLNDWNPSPNNGAQTLAANSTTLYVGGNFQTITVGGSSSPRGGIAAFNLSSGSLSSWNGDITGGTALVNRLALSGNILYLAGNFTTAAGQSRNRVAALDITTTNTATSWNPAYSGTVPIRGLAVSPDGTTVYIGVPMGGSGVTIGGQSGKKGVVALRASNATATTWNPALNLSTSGAIQTIAARSSAVYVGGNYSSNSAPTGPRYASAADPSTGAMLAWNAGLSLSGTSLVTTLALSGSSIYVGRSLSTAFIGGFARQFVAASDLTTRALTPLSLTFTPSSFTGGKIVQALAYNGTTLYVGGSFGSVNGSTREGLAAIDTTSSSGTVTSFDAASTSDPGITKLASSGANLCVASNAGIGVSAARPAVLNGTSGAVIGSTSAVDGDLYATVGDSAGGCYFAGYISGVESVTRPGPVIHLSASGVYDPAFSTSFDRTVSSLAYNSGTLYAGGNFALSGFTHNQAYLAQLSTSTAAYSSGAPVLNGPVTSTVSDGAGGWYVGGYFTQVAGTSQPYLAHLNSNFSVDSSFTPSLNGAVSALAFDGSTLYVSGQFDTAGGQPRYRMAAFDSTGAVQSWDPEPSSGASILNLAIGANGVYAVGRFNSIGGNSDIHCMAALDSTTGQETGWNAFTAYDATDCYQVAVDSGVVYLVGYFTDVYDPSGSSVVRNNAAAFLESDGTPTAWAPEPNGTPQGVFATSSGIYLTGDFSRIQGNPSLNIGAVTKSTGALLSGFASPFTSTASTPNTYGNLLTEIGGKIWVSGYLARPGEVPYFQVAAINPTTGALDSNVKQQMDGQLTSMVSNGSTVLSGGYFQGMTGSQRTGLAAVSGITGALTSWNPIAHTTDPPDGYSVDGIKIQGGSAYLLGNFDQLNGIARTLYGAVLLSDGSLTAWVPSATLSSSLSVDSSSAYIGFSSVDLSTGAGN